MVHLFAHEGKLGPTGLKFRRDEALHFVIKLGDDATVYFRFGLVKTETGKACFLGCISQNLTQS